MLRRLLMTAATLVALFGMIIGISASPASATTTLPAYHLPGDHYAHVQLAAKAQPAYKIYVVKRGNTLSGIAHRFHFKSWEKFYCANKKEIGKEPNLILPGMRLTIKESRHLCRIPVRHVARTPITVTTTSAVQDNPAPSTVSTSGFGSFQQCVIQRESGGDPTAYNTSSGASGLYGFLLSTWMGTPEGPQYPGGAYTAPVSAQNAAFAYVYAREGTAPWAPYDGC